MVERHANVYVYYIQLADENIWKSVNLWNIQMDSCGIIWGVLKSWGIPKTMGFNMKMVVHDLDDLGYPHDFGNLHIKLQLHVAGASLP